MLIVTDCKGVETSNWCHFGEISRNLESNLLKNVCKYCAKSTFPKKSPIYRWNWDF